DSNIEARIRPALPHRKRTAFRTWTNLLADPVLAHPAARLAIAHTRGSACRTVEKRVVRTQIERRIVKQQPNRDRTQLAARFLTQGFIQGVENPALTVLDLAGQGELVVFLRQALAVSFDHAAD